MADIASLGIKVTTTGAKEAAADLGKLDTASQKVEKSSQSAAKAMAANAKSAKELQFATRNLPAQFTDIATALGSGQRPLQVLLHQGGQIKDIFGGVGTAIRAMGGYVLGLVNPFTVAAAAVAALGIAWKNAQDEATEFNRSIILTGNYAKLTAKDMADMARQLDASTNATAGAASEALAQVNASGQFTAEQIGLVTKAALQMQDATGKAIEDTIKEFVALKGDPVDAILKLNDTQHFLTEATLEQIKSLKDQGKEADAAAVAIRAYADTINDRTPDVVNNLSLMAQWWRDVKSAVRELGDEAVDVFRDLDVSAKSFLQTYSEQVKGLANVLRTVKFVPFGGSLASAADNFANNANKPDFSNVRGGSGGGNVVESQSARARIKAEEEFERLAQSNLSKREKLEAEIKQIRELGAKAGKNDLEIQKEINSARARYQESLPKGLKPRKENTRGIENASDRFDDMVGSLRAELEGPLERAEQQHLKRVREIQQAARDGKRSHEDLTDALALEGEAYAKTADEIKHRFEAEVASLTGPVAQAQERHEAALRRIEELRKLGQLSAKQYADALNEEAKAFRQDAAAAERAADPIGALLSDMRDELDLIGKTNAERAVMIELRRQNIDAMSAEGQAAIEAAKTFEKEAEAKQRSIDLMDEFRSGASNALADIVTGAKSAKEAFADFFDDLARRIAQMIAERWIEKAFGAMGSSNGGSAGGGEGGWFAAIASIFASAKGNAFVNGQPVQAFANGGILDRPTFFGMAGGRIGVGGEAGTEAILPLHRGPDGKLGIRMEAANDGTPRNLALNQTFVVQGAPDRRTREQMARESGRAARREMARTGG